MASNANQKKCAPPRRCKWNKHDLLNVRKKCGNAPWKNQSKDFFHLFTDKCSTQYHCASQPLVSQPSWAQLFNSSSSNFPLLILSFLGFPIFFIIWSPLVIRLLFLTAFYGLYFSHYTYYKSCWTFCVGRYSYSNSNNPVTYFHWKILALAEFWTRDLPGTKPICYQLSYSGLDLHNFFRFCKFFFSLCLKSFLEGNTLAQILWSTLGPRIEN